MVVNEGRPLKRVKRTRVAAGAPADNLLDFFALPSPQAGPFRCAVRAWLASHARMLYAPDLFPSLVTWQTVFRVGDLTALDGRYCSSPVTVTLDIVEEEVARSRSVYCNQCRVVGWSGHPVCNKRYHFIIRSDDGARGEGYQKPCSRCGNILCLLEPRCKFCNFVVTTDDIEDIEEWVYSQLDDNSHLMHGVVHSNGYGHLLTLNGRAGGSKVLSGSDIMDFWDRLCRSIAVRKVSVMDVSSKYGVPYRVLHAITKGHSWYGNWGYEFGSGCYGLTVDAYQAAVDRLSRIPLSSFLFQGRGPRTPLQAKIAFYQSLSDFELSTVRDLFVFIQWLISQTHKSVVSRSTLKEAKTDASNILCAWTREEVERVQQAMVRVLQTAAADGRWVSRRTLKGAVCREGSSELLDYCLKHLGGKIAANGMIVRAHCSAISNSVEFRIEPSRFGSGDSRFKTGYPTEKHIIHDLKFLFDSLLNPESMVSLGLEERRDHDVDAATKLLDCKQFMKDYEAGLVMKDMHAIYATCHVVLRDQPRSDPVPPPELVILPINATVADLKREAAKAFEEVYVMFKRFQVDELLEYGRVDDSITINLLIGTCGTVVVAGQRPSKYGINRFRMERGIDNWTVDCKCGAKDDDGERMLSCDSCGVWQHTRCAGIDNSDPTPTKFICAKCVKSYTKESESIQSSIQDGSLVSLTGTSCRGDAKATDIHKLDAGLTYV